MATNRESNGTPNGPDLSWRARLAGIVCYVVDRVLLFLETDLKSGQIDSTWSARESSGQSCCKNLGMVDRVVGPEEGA